MKVLYLVHSGIEISETFISSLIIGLGRVCSEIKVVSGSRRSSYLPNVGVIYSSYYTNGFRVADAILRVSKIFGISLGYKIKNRYLKWSITRSLRKSLDWADVVHIDYLTSAVYVYEYLTLRTIPFVVRVHGYDITANLNDPVYKTNAIRALQSAHSIIAASNHSKRLITLLCGKGASIHVVRYGLDASTFKVASDSEKTSHPSVVAVGRLTGKKHPIALLHAFKLVLERMPNAKLEIIGDGPLLNAILQRANDLELNDSVILTGALPNEQVKKRLRTAWVFCQHSVTPISGDQEGFALSPAEAALFEIPVVSTIHNGITEHVLDNKTGYLVQEYDYESMGDRIYDLLKDKDLRDKFGKNGRINIQKMCSESKQISRVLDILKKASEI